MTSGTNANIDEQTVGELYCKLLDLSDSQRAYVVVDTTVVRHEQLWRVLTMVALVALFLSSSFTPMESQFNPAVGLLALLVVAFILAALAYLARRNK